MTDNTDATIRGKTESVLSALPLLGMLIVAGGFGIIVDAIGYGNMFILLGALISASGIFGLFFIKDSPKLLPNKKNYFSEIAYGFKPSTIKANKKLYLLLSAMGIYGIGSQIFMPYIIIFMQEYLGFDVIQYSIVLGAVILLASVAVVLSGRATDKINKITASSVSAIFMILGLIAFYLVAKLGVAMPKTGLIILSIATALVMIYGYIMILALVGALIRDKTPEEQAGKLQGIRLIFYVLIPMFVGPAVGEAINSASGKTYVDEASGALTSVPSPEIFIAAAAVMLLMFIPLFVYKRMRDDTVKLSTKYSAGFAAPSEEALINSTEAGDNRNAGIETPASAAEELVPLPEYPRPSLKRDSYINLNGKWRFRGGGVDASILVPYSPETKLSGVEGFKRKRGSEYVYSREFDLPRGFVKDRVLLHFGAVDDEAKVFVNGKLVCEHVGGYTPFYADITDALKDGENALEVRVKDDVTERGGARGKQSVKPRGIWYTDTSGIWQTVWLESVPAEYVKDVNIVADLCGASFEIEATGDCTVEIESEKITLTAKLGEDGVCRVRVDINNPRLWSPETPNLYTAKITCGKDEVQTYFALRTFGIGEVNGKKRLMLNGLPYFVNAVLDQGYYSDGMYTPASYKAFEDDITLCKSLGFNTLRKHAKIEPAVWYELCDRMGMIVWQDIVNGGGKYSFMTVAALPFIGKRISDDKYKRFGRASESSRAVFEAEMQETVRALRFFPCICMWTLFNEGWGQFDGTRLTQKLKELDGTRVVDSASGWHDCGGELCSLHTYFKKQYMPNDERAVVISEFGGYGLAVQDHLFAPDKKFGYKNFQTTDALNAAFEKLYKTEIKPLKDAGLSGCVYTQLSDVEEEVNGLVTFDRAVQKITVNTAELLE